MAVKPFLRGKAQKALIVAWVFRVGVTLQYAQVGQQFQLVRIGESFLMTFGFNVDYSRNNVGVTFNLEPRFLSRTQFASRSGIDIPVAGAYGLE